MISNGLHANLIAMVSSVDSIRPHHIGNIATVYDITLPSQNNFVIMG